MRAPPRPCVVDRRARGHVPGPLVAGADLVGEIAVRLGAARARGEQVDRQAVAGASDRRTARGMIVSYTRSPRCRRTSSPTSELRRVRGVVHRQHRALDLESRVEVVGDEADRGQQLTEALEREVLALDRDERRVGRRQRVDRQQPERGRAIDQDVVELAGAWDRRGPRGAARAARAASARPRRRRGRSTTGSASGRRPASSIGELVELRPSSMTASYTDRSRARSIAERARGVALGVEVDDQHPVAREGQVAGQIDNRRGLSDAALLVGTGDRLAHLGGHPGLHSQASILASGPPFSLALAIRARQCRNRGFARRYRGHRAALVFHVKRRGLTRRTRCFT